MNKDMEKILKHLRLWGLLERWDEIIAEARKKLGDDVLLMGNVDTYSMTCDEKTSVATTIDHIKGIIDAGVDAVMPGCDLWPAIIEENMKACVDTTHEYGKKASPAVGRL